MSNDTTSKIIQTLEEPLQKFNEITSIFDNDTNNDYLNESRNNPIFFGFMNILSAIYHTSVQFSEFKSNIAKEDIRYHYFQLVDNSSNIILAQKIKVFDNSDVHNNNHIMVDLIDDLSGIDSYYIHRIDIKNPLFMNLHYLNNFDKIINVHYGVFSYDISSHYYSDIIELQRSDDIWINQLQQVKIKQFRNEIISLNNFMLLPLDDLIINNISNFMVNEVTLLIDLLHTRK